MMDNDLTDYSSATAACTANSVIANTWAQWGSVVNKINNITVHPDTIINIGKEAITGRELERLLKLLKYLEKAYPEYII